MEFIECPKCGNLIEGGDGGNTVCDQCGHSLTTEEQAEPFNSAASSARKRMASSGSSSKEELRTIYSNQMRSEHRGHNLLLAGLTLVALFLLVYSAERYDHWQLYLVLVALFPFGVTGYYIGRRTGNGLEGFWFCNLLGPLGIVITFVLTDKTREPCEECAELLKLQASVCPHCGAKHQRRSW